MNSVPEFVDAAPSMRLPHQRPGVDRGLCRGGPTTAAGVEASFNIGDFLSKVVLPQVPNIFGKFL